MRVCTINISAIPLIWTQWVEQKKYIFEVGTLVTESEITIPLGFSVVLG